MLRMACPCPSCKRVLLCLPAGFIRIRCMPRAGRFDVQHLCDRSTFILGLRGCFNHMVESPARDASHRMQRIKVRSTLYGIAIERD